MINRKFLILIAFFIVIKGIQVLHLSYLTQCSAPDRSLGIISFAAGDTFSYTGAMENYIKTGEYYFYNGKEKVYAGRMPHYAVPYYLFRQFLSQEASHDLIILYQFIWELIASFLFLLLIYQIFKSNIAVGIGAFILVVSTNWTNFTYYASPESISISFLLVFLYCYQKYLDLRNDKYLILAGILLGLLVTHKAYYILIFLFIGIDLIIYYSQRDKNNLLIIAKKSALVALPMILFILPWVYRNYTIQGKFIPLQQDTFAGYYYSNAYLAFRNYLGAWGGDIVHWEKTSAGCYFIPQDHINCDFSFPEYVFTPEKDLSEIEKVRDSYVLLQRNYTDSLDNFVANEFNELATDFKLNNQFRYYIISPLVLVKRFLWNSGSYFLPINSSNPCYKWIQLPIKFTQSMIYWVSITAGMIGLFFMTKRKKLSFIYPAIILMIIMIFPILFRMVEWRFLRTTQPILYIGIVYILVFLIEKIFRKNF